MGEGVGEEREEEGGIDSGAVCVWRPGHVIAFVI